MVRPETVIKNLIDFLVRDKNLSVSLKILKEENLFEKLLVRVNVERVSGKLLELIASLPVEKEIIKRDNDLWLILEVDLKNKKELKRLNNKILKLKTKRGDRK